MSVPVNTTPRPRLVVEPPPGFVGLPLDESAEDNAASLRVLAARIAPPAGQDVDRMTEHLGVLAALMAPHNVRLFGRFAAGSGPGGPALASLALAVPALSSVDPVRAGSNRRAAAATLLAMYRRHNPHAEARIVDLPIGPAVAAVSAGQYRLPPEATGRPVTVVRPEFKAEFQLLAPDGVHLVVMAVTTDDEAGWPDVAAQAMRVATSLRFEEPSGEG